MHANQKSFNDTLAGSDKQFYCPPLQRAYQWDEPQWQTLFDDLKDAADSGQDHFFGTLILTEGAKEDQITRHMLIDGQQRLTTLTVLLARGAQALGRRTDASDEHMDFCKDIDKVLRNRKAKKAEHAFKVWPTSRDQQLYSALMRGEATPRGARFTRLAEFFDRQFSDAQLFPSADALAKFLEKVLDTGFTVTIEMGSGDNICAVFSSINGKGCPLKPIDLLKNLILMRADMSLDDAYEKYWKPVELGISDDELERLFRKIVLARGGWCNAAATLDRFNELYKTKSLKEVVEELTLWKRQYLALRDGFPQRAFEHKTMLALERISRARGFMQETSHLLIEGCLVMLERSALSEAEFRQCLVGIENFVVRIAMHDRQMTRDATGIMHKVLTLQGQAAVDKFVGELLTAPSYLAATDEQLVPVLAAKAFKSQSLRTWARYVLLGIDAFHNADVTYQQPSLEHVAPQKLGGAMQWAHIPVDGDYQHRLGNLTILKTAWNEEIRRASFPEKQSYFAQSRLWLNDCFAAKPAWTAADINERTEALLAEFAKVWPYGRLTDWQ